MVLFAALQQPCYRFHCSLRWNGGIGCGNLRRRPTLAFRCRTLQQPRIGALHGCGHHHRRHRRILAVTHGRYASTCSWAYAVVRRGGGVATRWGTKVVGRMSCGWRGSLTGLRRVRGGHLIDFHATGGWAPGCGCSARGAARLLDPPHGKRRRPLGGRGVTSSASNCSSVRRGSRMVAAAQHQRRRRWAGCDESSRVVDKTTIRQQRVVVDAVAGVGGDNARKAQYAAAGAAHSGFRGHDSAQHRTAPSTST